MWLSQWQGFQRVHTCGTVKIGEIIHRPLRNNKKLFVVRICMLGDQSSIEQGQDVGLAC